MSLKTLKQDIRKQALASRDAMPETQRELASLKIKHIICQYMESCFEKTVAGFWPIRSEIDLRPALVALYEMGVRLCLPVCLSPNRLVFREFVLNSPMMDTGWGTCGPGAEASVIDPDIILMPLVAFDSLGNRIGYGAGHYDRAVDRMRKERKDPCLIGVGFASQEFSCLPAEPHDIVMSLILTENGLRCLSPE